MGEAMSELIRRRNSRDRVLKFLQDRGTCTNVELNAVCFRYGARILELRAAGHDIRTGAKSGGVVRYDYLGMRSPVQASLLEGAA
jgi:hypothetical protein